MLNHLMIDGAYFLISGHNIVSLCHGSLTRSIFNLERNQDCNKSKYTKENLFSHILWQFCIFRIFSLTHLFCYYYCARTYVSFPEALADYFLLCIMCKCNCWLDI